MQSKGPMFRFIEDAAQRVAGGEKICLACWCAPSPCHADLIAKEINNLKNPGVTSVTTVATQKQSRTRFQAFAEQP
jgi:hypothetical protein